MAAYTATLTSLFFAAVFFENLEMRLVMRSSCLSIVSPSEFPVLQAHTRLRSL